MPSPVPSPRAPALPRDAVSVASRGPAPSPRTRAFRRIHSLWRLRTYLLPYRRQLVVMAIAAASGVAAGLVVPLVTKEVIDGPITHHDAVGLVQLSLLAVALGVVEAFMIFLRRWIQATAVLGLETTLRDDLYAHLQRLPMGFHSRWHSGQLLSRATTDLSTLRRFLGFGMLFLVINILQLLAVTLVLLRMYWPLGVVVAGSALPIVYVSLRFERRYVTISRRVQDQEGDLATLVEEAAVGIRVIKAFGRRHHVYDDFDEGARKLYDSSMDKVRLSSKFWTFLEVVPNVTLAFVLLLGALAVGQQRISLGTLVAFITLMLQLVWPIASLGYILSMAQESMTASDRLLEVFDTAPDIADGTRRLAHPRGHLRLEGVGFTYPDMAPGAAPVGGAAGHPPRPHPPVLRDVWLEVLPGETVALVGATGSGKTTITSLVLRLYDVTAGRITIDGVDIRELTLPCLRSVVSTAFEEPTLFSMSVRENLTLGRPDASDADIHGALQVAQASFAYDLPWGLDTRIGEQGMSLSGGQRQRLALARAVITQPKILVLDDTLSALDVETEALVEDALRHVLADATGIVVAHRASTVLLADKVALVQDGTVSHVGTHRELLATVPAYRELLAQDAQPRPQEVAS